MLVAATCGLVLPAPQPAAVADPDRDRRPDGLDRLRLLQRARPRPDADHGRGGDDHPAAAGAELPAQPHPEGKHGPAPRRATRSSPRSPALAATALSYHYLLRDAVARRISEFHLANSYKGGGGTNVVNVILVDFRGFDTFGEIIVLGIAALLIYALTEALLGGPVRARAAEPQAGVAAGGRRASADDGGPDPRHHAGRADGRLLHLPARPQRAGRRLHRRSRRVDRRRDAIHGQRLCLGLGAAALSLSRGHRRGRADRRGSPASDRGSSASRS